MRDAMRTRLLRTVSLCSRLLLSQGTTLTLLTLKVHHPGAEHEGAVPGVPCYCWTQAAEADLLQHAVERP